MRAGINRNMGPVYAKPDESEIGYPRIFVTVRCRLRIFSEQQHPLSAFIDWKCWIMPPSVVVWINTPSRPRMIGSQRCMKAMRMWQPVA